MTAVSSTSAAFVAALKTQLVARFAAHLTLSVVRVFATEPNQDVSRDDVVVLIRDTVDEFLEWTHPSYMRNVNATIPGYVQAHAVDPNLDTAWQSAMDRAALILDEVIQEVILAHPTVGRQTFSANVEHIASRPYVPSDAAGWVCRAEFEIIYRARVA